MKKVFLILFLGLCLAPLSISAQEAGFHHHNSCGTSLETQQVLFKNMVELRNRYPNFAAPRAVVYIPVWFHMVAASNGTGRTTEANVAEMVCEWNKFYETNGLDMQFYIKGFSKIDLDALYNGPQSFAGTNRMLTTKKTDAMNVYLVNNCGDGSNPNEIILAYYANRGTNLDAEYTYDWIVCSNSQVNGPSASTIAHEAGHLFSLPHTFYGWEANGGPFNPSTAAGPCAPASLNYNGRVVTVEKVARTGSTKNCDIAADGFCDTAEDYYFGLATGSNCVYSGIAKDPDCVAVNPDEPNIMGYFSCPRTFSTEQKTAIKNNYLNHPKRAYLRAGNTTPSLAAATPTLIFPSVGATTYNFNNVQLDWSDVSGAFGYSVDVSRFASFTTATKNFYVSSSDFNINALNAPSFLLTGIKYYWRVKAVVPYNNCNNTSITGNFITGTVNAVNDIAGVTQFSVSPNPLSKTQNLSLQMNSETAFDARIKLFNVTGQMIKSENRRFAAGYSEQSLSVSDLTNGTYILAIESEKGVLNKRIVIQ
jgi:hypothetical protein